MSYQIYMFMTNLKNDCENIIFTTQFFLETDVDEMQLYYLKIKNLSWQSET